MMYADDTVESKEEELKSRISRFEKSLDKRKLLVNVEKSKVVVFSKGGGGGRKTEWRMNGGYYLNEKWLTKRSAERKTKEGKVGA